jgi:hypothetical protein
VEEETLAVTGMQGGDDDRAAFGHVGGVADEAFVEDVEYHRTVVDGALR